jgi:hypothetical protein
MRRDVRDALSIAAALPSPTPTRSPLPPMNRIARRQPARVGTRTEYLNPSLKGEGCMWVAGCERALTVTAVAAAAHGASARPRVSLRPLT